MSKEVFPYNHGEFEPESSVDSVEDFLRRESMAPAVAASIRMLRKAAYFDEALSGVDASHTRRYRIRSAGNYSYPFIHDRIILSPKRGSETTVARREMRFSVTKEDTENIRPKYIFITDFDDEGELVAETIMTEDKYGWYDSDVSLTIEEDHITDIQGLQQDEYFDANFFAEHLNWFDLEPQTNRYSEVL